MTTAAARSASSSGSSRPRLTDDQIDAAAEVARSHPNVYAWLCHALDARPHHVAWLRALKRTVETPGGRLLLIAPPGSAKSTYTSLVLPLWYLGRWPDRAVLATTSSDVMAGQFHGVVELALRTNKPRRLVFPEDAGKPDPARGWSMDGLYLRGVPEGVKDPSYRVSGFRSKVIGSRCHLLILDDPVDQETASSAVEMGKVRQYLDLTLLTRLHPGGSAVCITTRWGEEDVAAHLMGQGWRVELWPQLSPAYSGDARDAEARAPLWPERYPLEWVLEERARLGSAQFELIHQGNPLLMGGDVYRSAAWFRPLPPTFVPEIAPRAVRMLFVDTAFSAKASADYTCAVTLAYDPRDPQRRLYLVGLFRKRVAEDGLAEALAEHVLAMAPHAVGVEVPAFRQEATQGLLLRLRELLYGRHAVDVRGVPVSTDKTVRARLPAARGEAGLLFVDKTLPEWPAAERELLGFPVAAHDDVSDALAGATVMALGPVGQLATARPQKVRFG